MEEKDRHVGESQPSLSPRTKDFVTVKLERVSNDKKIENTSGSGTFLSSRIGIREAQRKGGSKLEDELVEKSIERYSELIEKPLSRLTRSFLCEPIHETFRRYVALFFAFHPFP